MAVILHFIFHRILTPLHFLRHPQEFRAFELLRSGLDRSKYLLVKEAKIIAMTCTHAALKRHDLVELAFKVFLRPSPCEEDAALLESLNCEFSPLVRQHPDGGGGSDPGDRDLHPAPAAGKKSTFETRVSLAALGFSSAPE